MSHLLNWFKWLATAQLFSRMVCVLMVQKEADVVYSTSCEYDHQPLQFMALPFQSSTRKIIFLTVYQPKKNEFSCYEREECFV